MAARVSASEAITVRWPVVEDRSAARVIVPVVESRMLPVPWAVTGVLTVRASPVTMTIAPLPAVVATPL